MSGPPESPTSSSRDRHRVNTFVPHQPRWYQCLGAWLIVTLVRLVAATLRYRWHDDSGYFNDMGAPAIYVTWHNRLALSMRAYYCYVHKHVTTPGLSAFV